MVCAVHTCVVVLRAECPHLHLCHKLEVRRLSLLCQPRRIYIAGSAWRIQLVQIRLHVRAMLKQQASQQAFPILVQLVRRITQI